MSTSTPATASAKSSAMTSTAASASHPGAPPMQPGRSCAVFLLQGLLQVDKTTALGMIQSTLEYEQAARRLQRVWKRHVRRSAPTAMTTITSSHHAPPHRPNTRPRKRRKRDAASTPVAPTPPPVAGGGTTNRYPWQPWLLPMLQSSARVERTAGWKWIVQSCKDESVLQTKMAHQLMHWMEGSSGHGQEVFLQEALAVLQDWQPLAASTPCTKQEEPSFFLTWDWLTARLRVSHEMSPKAVLAVAHAIRRMRERKTAGGTDSLWTHPGRLAALLGTYYQYSHDQDYHAAGTAAVEELTKILKPLLELEPDPSASGSNTLGRRESSATMHEEDDEDDDDDEVDEDDDDEDDEDDDIDEDDDDDIGEDEGDGLRAAVRDAASPTFAADKDGETEEGHPDNDHVGEEHIGDEEEFKEEMVEDEDLDSMDDDDDDDDDDDVCPDDEEEEGVAETQEEMAARLNEQVMAMNRGLRDGDDEDDDEDEDAPLEMEMEELADAQEEEKSPVEPPAGLSPPLPVRRRTYVKASMLVLAQLYPPLHHHQQQNPPSNSNNRRTYLTLRSENALLESINKIVKPPKKAINTKVIMRRAPTQEEFFRGTLSRNPIPISILKPATGTTNRSGDSYEPTVGDLRQHIANDLQMADSAELIEIIVANKILDVGLKIRVVHDVLWRSHLIHNSSTGMTSLGSSGATYLSAGPGLSLIFGGGSSGGAGGRRSITAETPASSLPPLVATYRLAGVDGEATEDTAGVGDLVDPEAPAESTTPEEVEKALEAEYGITRLVTEGRGIHLILRSIQSYVADILRRIRRDDVGCEGRNPARAKFQRSAPFQGLTLLRHCSKLASNRRKLLRARAPTVLLTMLMDVLKALEEPCTGEGGQTTMSNSTAEILQELIEVLTSDISTSSNSATIDTEEGGYESDLDHDASSMPLLLESIETISLSAPLRGIIGKLLPFLTYGQADLSRELAQHFHAHIAVESLYECELEDESTTKSSILMSTFVHTASSLPPTDVCNSLRIELINCGFIERLVLFISKDIPKQPPTWSPALWTKDDPAAKKKGKRSGKQRTQLEEAWRAYYSRGGIRTAFGILTGLCKKHGPTQSRIAMFADFLNICHWIEATSDNAAANISTNGFGLVAETLLDEMIDGNSQVAALVDVARKKTRLRKKELALERRTRTLAKMTPFGPVAIPEASADEAAKPQSSVRDAAASILGPVFGLFRESHSANASTTPPSGSANNKADVKGQNSPKKPAWLAEAELMEDEKGLTCAVCQEGRSLQPTELLGLYAFVKKVAIPVEQCGSRSSVDGSALLKALQSVELPQSMKDAEMVQAWFTVGKVAGEDLPNTSSSSLSLGSSARRNTVYTTTVSAGNAIHISCHRKARQADRNHPKAPKSEWEGAALRNSRINCNVIVPLVSSRSSKVPLMAVDSALTEHQGTVSNLLGTTPKSMLWVVLFDVRLLLLRMAYGEALNSDCGGGSLASNCHLLFHQLLMIDMFDHDAQVDQPGESQLARSLPSGLLAACAIEATKDDKGSVSKLASSIADAAPMAVLTSIVFHNGADESGKTGGKGETESHKRQWMLGREYFLQALVICAGRRHALGVTDSGCLSSRNSSSRQRSSSFAEWNSSAGDEPGPSRGRSSRRSPSKPSVEDFQNPLRPMITLYAICDVLSAEFSVGMEDTQVQESVDRLVRVVEECQRSKSITDLLRKAKVTMDHDKLLSFLQKGMMVA